MITVTEALVGLALIVLAILVLLAAAALIILAFALVVHVLSRVLGVLLSDEAKP